MSLAVVRSRALSGIKAKLVTIEVHISHGLPGFQMVGLAATAVKEAKERVRSAIKNSGFEFPITRITVNLAPADLPKEGGRYDLAIALGILAASEQIQKTALDDLECTAELALSGDLRGVQGALPVVYAASKEQKTILLAKDNAKEASLIKDANIIAANTLQDVVMHLNGLAPIAPFIDERPSFVPQYEDLADVRGQENAKRALLIAAAGGHSLLFKGPPGSGKTMLASRMPGILPELDDDSAMQSAMLYSISHQGFDERVYKKRAFRAPHHSASTPALVGGGSPPKPGEISLAHLGVLFLDELPEFSRQVLESLREPLEAGKVMISRAQYQYTFPADFQLIAAMNPCPCGYFRDASARCSCTREQVLRYQNKLSGPLLDRIDLHVEVEAISHKMLLAKNTGTTVSSEQYKLQVIEAQKKAFGRSGRLNAHLNNKCLNDVVALAEQDEAWLLDVIERLKLSARYYHRMLKVARTIADLDECDDVGRSHLKEALSFARRQSAC